MSGVRRSLANKQLYNLNPATPKTYGERKKKGPGYWHFFSFNADTCDLV